MGSNRKTGTKLDSDKWQRPTVIDNGGGKNGRLWSH